MIDTEPSKKIKFAKAKHKTKRHWIPCQARNDGVSEILILNPLLPRLRFELFWEAFGKRLFEPVFGFPVEYMR